MNVTETQVNFVMIQQMVSFAQFWPPHVAKLNFLKIRLVINSFEQRSDVIVWQCKELARDIPTYQSIVLLKSLFYNNLWRKLLLIIYLWDHMDPLPTLHLFSFLYRSQRRLGNINIIAKQLGSAVFSSFKLYSVHWVSTCPLLESVHWTNLRSCRATTIPYRLYPINNTVGIIFR